MKKEKTRVATILFLLGILIAGIANAFSKQLMKTYVADVSAPAITPFFSTALFCVNLFLYLILLVFWIHSVQRRLLRDRARNYLISAACCAVAMLVLRSIKYRLIDEWALDAARYLWYLYYLPMILLPTARQTPTPMRYALIDRPCSGMEAYCGKERTVSSRLARPRRFAPEERRRHSA